jgi:hypothetical protein
MKDSFFGYYPPTEAEYQRLWREATIVLDTNVLLNLYRLPTTARAEFLAVLELLRDRLWIPHQVALEFQRRRLTVIATERKATEDALESAGNLVVELKRKVEALQLDKRGLQIEPKPILDDFDHANTKLVEAISAAHKAQLEIASVDPVRDRLDHLLSGCVGDGPKSQAELDAWIKDGEDRFREKIPPGFADADKEKNPNEATFIHDHIKYQRKFGDLILWRQTLEYAKSKGIKSLLFITADRKEDWWWKEQGKTIGAHPELVREMSRVADVELFWMYSAAQFAEQAAKYTAATFSTEAVAELKQVIHASPGVAVASGSTARIATGAELFHSDGIGTEVAYEWQDPQAIESAVFEWLRSTRGHAELNNRGFPDFLVREGDDTHGYDVKFLRHFDRMLLPPGVVNAMLRGYLETKEGRLSGFTLVVVVREFDFMEIAGSDRISELHRRLGRLLARYPISSIVVGAVLGERFEPLVWQREADHSDL